MSFIESIFSIKDYGETHKIMRLLGLKIKFPKSEYAKKKKESPYYYYKKNNIDITTLPPATGQLRDIQLANLALLKELDYVCKQNGLKYWLDAGTLIGAIRHKGFIPWDDDIDIAMMREDYEKIIDAFNKSSRNPDIYADYCRDTKNTCQYMIKIQHKKCHHLFVDIFPFDKYGKKISKEEQLSKTKIIKNIRKRLQKNTSFSTPNDIVKQKIETAMKDEVLKNNDSVDESNLELVWGLDFNHSWDNWFTDYEVIFPLKEIEFEGIMFSCMNNPDAFLTRVYGDYMSYPPKITMGHSMFIELTDEERQVIEELKKG